MNTTTIVGHIGKQPELKYTGSGQAVLSFSVATNEVYYDKDGKKHEKTEWHNCVAWRSLAESLAEVAVSGTRLMLIGNMQTRSWEGKQGKRYQTELVVQHAGIPLSASKHTDKANRGEDEQGAPQEPDNQAQSSADLPF